MLMLFSVCVLWFRGLCTEPAPKGKTKSNFKVQAHIASILRWLVQDLICVSARLANQVQYDCNYKPSWT